MKTIFNLLKSVALCVVILVMSVTTSAQSSCYLIGGISDDIEPTIENAEALMTKCEEDAKKRRARLERMAG